VIGPLEDYDEGVLRKIDPTGATIWRVAGHEFGVRGVAVDQANAVIAVGTFQEKIDLGMSGLVYGDTGNNGFVAKFAP
jgi:hypothetical protein